MASVRAHPGSWKFSLPPTGAGHWANHHLAWTYTSLNDCPTRCTQSPRQGDTPGSASPLIDSCGGFRCTCSSAATACWRQPPQRNVPETPSDATEKSLTFLTVLHSAPVLWDAVLRHGDAHVIDVGVTKLVSLPARASGDQHTATMLQQTHVKLGLGQPSSKTVL